MADGLNSPGAAAPVDDALIRASASHAPWLAPLATAVRELAARDHAGRIGWLNAQARARHLRNASGLPIILAAADDAGDAAYEAHIHATGRVPTRAASIDSAHDVFNALVWLRFPHAKAVLNARQAAAIARDGVRPVRGGERDAATLIDENGLVLVSDDAAVRDALVAHDWPWLFIRERARWHRGIRPHLFGHALMDKLLQPYKAICAHAIVLVDALAGEGDAALDEALARFIGSAALSPRLLLPLPVLGVPGWWPANEAAAFYDDPAVFRPLRRAA